LLSKRETMFVHIVDDDESVRKGLSRLLRSNGIECRTYDSPEQFLAEVKSEGQACVIMDITMPRMTGLVLSRQLKEKGVTLPIIAVSARDDPETRQMIRALGVQFFLRKPVDNQALIDAITWVVQTNSDHESAPH
jgi:FixJ family two-component response regulator